jgi:hypothetical protein
MSEPEVLPEIDEGLGAYPSHLHPWVLRVGGKRRNSQSHTTPSAVRQVDPDVVEAHRRPVTSAQAQAQEEGVVVLDNRHAVADRVNLNVGFSPFTIAGTVPASSALVKAKTHIRVEPLIASPIYLRVLWDGGADENVMPLKELRKHFPNMSIVPSPSRLRALSGIGGSIHTKGLVEFILHYGERKFVDYFMVVDMDLAILIGNRARLAMGLSLGGLVPPAPGATSSSVLSRTESSALEDRAQLFDVNAPPLAPLSPYVSSLLDANKAIPADAVCSHSMALVRVDIPSSMKPHYEYPRRIPRIKHDAVSEQVEEWLKDGVIEKCPRPSQWNLNLVVVNKATEPGAEPKYRVCLDPRPINKVTPNDLHPLPHILDYLDDACGAAVFTSLDLKGSFHQLTCTSVIGITLLSLGTRLSIGSGGGHLA